MQKCNVCYNGFDIGQDIIQKSCGKHVLYRACLYAGKEGNQLCLYGPCDCNTAGLDFADTGSLNGWREAWYCALRGEPIYFQ
jgi:hypothetical protein